ncbi:maleylacetoacetate isomerase [Allosphingosinicella indica]|uniref:Maleylacetoacetate isomerase n=1 Tax=Allosphingosinicella indica TaxID=941907 RepID=A0A1X7G7K1_9SPHN|nr:maleylacetoacetate isomerase [Allosphingosinicella indica]SMF64912.1 maleylacetoacetate isomerase [Allosphingosinicella indica]
MTMPLLHDYWRSSASYRVRIALNLKRIAYRHHPVDLAAGAQKDAAYRAINPQGFVPMLEIDGHAIPQSLAIIDYLDAIFRDPPLVPANAADRAHVLALALAIAADIHPVNNLRILKYLAGSLKQPETARDDWYRHWLAEGLQALEAMAAARAGRFLFGDTVTLADICLVPQMYNARRYKLPLDPYPLLVRVDAEAQALEPFAEAHPDRFVPDVQKS